MMERAEPKRLLVTGGSGFLGWNLCAAPRPGWQLQALYQTHAVELPDVTAVRCDLTDFGALKETFGRIRPDAVVHAAAASQPNYCQLHPEESRRINVDAALAVASLAADAGAALVFLSSDLVFDGRRSPYREDDPVSPVSLYGEQKVEAEQGIRERHPAATICRVPLMFGPPGGTAVSFIQPFLAEMREGRELKLFTDEYRTPVSAGTAIEGILLALGRIPGVLHLGGRERISRYEFGKLMQEILGLDRARIIPCRQDDIRMPAPRPADVSLDSSRAFALGYDPLPLKQQLEAIKELI